MKRHLRAAAEVSQVLNICSNANGQMPCEATQELQSLESWSRANFTSGMGVRLNLNPTQKFWTNKLPLALRQANNPPRTERNQASIENKVAFRDEGSRQTEESSLPAKGELNPSPDGYPLQRRKQEDDEDAYESRQEARTGAL
jgi:hypothetical protein